MVCHQHLLLKTSSRCHQKLKDSTGKPHQEANVVAVWGQMSTDGGHATLLVLDVPLMKKIALYQQKEDLGNGEVHF